jgi:hypothetical protein
MGNEAKNPVIRTELWNPARRFGVCPELVLRHLDEQIIPISARETTGALFGARVITPAPQGLFYTASLPISVMSVSDI